MRTSGFRGIAHFVEQAFKTRNACGFRRAVFYVLVPALIQAAPFVRAQTQPESGVALEVNAAHGKLAPESGMGETFANSRVQLHGGVAPVANQVVPTLKRTGEKVASKRAGAPGERGGDGDGEGWQIYVLSFVIGFVLTMAGCLATSRRWRDARDPV